MERNKDTRDRLLSKADQTVAPYYTIPKEFKKILTEDTAASHEVREVLRELWVGDLWDHLENPPDELTIEHFYAMCPARMGNGELKAKLAVAQCNLDISRYREGKKGKNITEMLADGPSTQVATLAFCMQPGGSSL